MVRNKTSKPPSELTSRGFARLSREEFDQLLSNLPTERDELLWWMVRDPRFFLEGFTKIRLETGDQSHWHFNRPQNHYYETVGRYRPDGAYLIVEPDNEILKSRQWGFSTIELGFIYHSFCFRPGYISKVISYEDTTATKLKRMVDLFHDSAVDIVAGLLPGVNPYSVLPFEKKPRNQHTLECEALGTIIEFTTQGGKGQGRSLTTNRQYWTEYQSWTNIEEAAAGFVGSFVKDGSAIHTKDYTGSGVGTQAHLDYKLARSGESAFRFHFYGRHDFEYSEEFLARQKQKLRGRFVSEYPATPEEAWRKDDAGIFDRDHIEAAGGYDPESGLFTRDGVYWENEHDIDGKDRAEIAPVITCDPAEGVPKGSYSVIKVRDARSGAELQPCWRQKATPRKTALQIEKLAKRWGALICVERNNHGHAVHALLVEHGFEPQCYKHEDGRLGWPEGSATKAVLESDYEESLADGTIELPSENERDEASQYCVNPNGKTGRPLIKTSEGARFYDDEVIASMIANTKAVRSAALRYATHRKRKRPGVHVRKGSHR